MVIHDVILEGNRSIQGRELKSYLRVENRHWYSTKSFDRRIIHMDALTIKTYYLSRGFLSVTVRDSIAYLDDKVDVYYKIREGKQYYLRSVTVRGNTILPETTIIDLLGFWVHEPYNPVYANSQLSVLEEEYQRYGKLYATVNISDAVTDSVDVVVWIKEGIDVFVKRIIIEGNEPVKRHLVEREVTIDTMALFQLDRIEETQRRIKETGVFSLVNISPVRAGSADSLVNLLIELRQFKTREWISEGGVYPVEFFENNDPLPGIGGIIEWRNRSLFNSTTSFSTKLSGHLPFEQTFYYPKITFNMSLANQWFLGQRIPTKMQFYYETLKKVGETEKPNIHRYGWEISNKYSFDNRSFMRTGINWEKFIEPREYDMDNNRETKDIEQRSIDADLHLDYSDDPLFPTQGYRFDISLSQSGGMLLGGTRSYFKYDLGIGTYIPLFRQIIIGGRIKYGQINGWSSEYDDLRFDLFYLGGSSSLRGWDTFMFSTLNGLPAGNTIRLLTNWEIRFPLFWLLGMEIFVDGGQLTSHTKAVAVDRMEWNTGAGLTLRTPLGPIRLDYAWPVDNRQDWKIHLGVHYIF